MTRIPPMEYLGPAVRQLRKDRHLTLEEVANQMRSYDSGNLSRFERGQQSIDADKLQEIARILGPSVSEIYALAEKLQRADPKSQNPDQEQLSEVSEEVTSSVSFLALASKTGGALQTSAEVQRYPFEVPASGAWEFVLIPSVIVHTDAGGHSTISVDQSEARHPIPKALFDGLGFPLERAGLIHIRGDAMNSTLCDGDLAVIDCGEVNIESGKVYALLVQDEIWVRRLIKSPTGISLLVDNKNGLFTDLQMTSVEFKGMRIIGRVRLRWGTTGL